MPPSVSCNRWTFTSFRTIDEIDESLELSHVKGHVSFAVWQGETTTSGRYHIQGYVEFRNKITRITAQELIGDEKCHVEMAKGKPSENWAYCTKNFSHASAARCVGYLDSHKWKRHVAEQLKMDRINKKISFITIHPLASHEKLKIFTHRDDDELDDANEEIPPPPPLIREGGAKAPLGRYDAALRRIDAIDA